MKMKLHTAIIFSAALAACAVTASAQNLDPKVEVNRDYEGKQMEVQKPFVEMAVPDSVLRFDLDFDYSVFENPYKGAYEFKPYTMELQPAGHYEAPVRFYLNAGAGYRLHPTLDMVWAPCYDGPFKLDVYAHNRSYVGSYRKMQYADPSVTDSRVLLTDRKNILTDKGLYDILSTAGVSGRYDWRALTGFFDVSYYGLLQRDELRRRAYNGMDASLRFRSNDTDAFLTYDVKADYRLGFDDVKDGDSMRENVLDVDAVLAMSLMENHKMRFDLGVEMNSYSDCFNTGSVMLELAPHYMFRYGRWNFDLGFRVAPLLKTGEVSDTLMYRNAPGQYVYPDVDIAFDAIPGAMKTYLRVGGGPRLNSYSSFLSRNHHFDMTYGRGRWGLLDNTVERVSVTAGLDGRIGSSLSYDFRVGYANYKNDFFDAVTVLQPLTSGQSAYMPGIGWSDSQKVFAALDWKWENESFRFDGNLLCTPWTDLDAPGLFKPAVLTGDAAFTYNWNRRIYAGVDCMFSTGRNGSVLYYDDMKQDAKVPGYADLGVYFEYMTSRKLSFWLRGGNLLDMTIQRDLLYAEEGVYFTLGICLKL